MHFGKKQSNFLQKNWLQIIFIIIVSLFSLFPIVINPGNRLAGQGDVLFITWTINQVIEKIPFDLFNFFQTNAFHSFKDTLAYSDIFLYSALISYIPVVISGNPLLAFNISLIASQILVLLIIYYWLYDMTNDKLASLAGTIAFGLSQIRFFFHPYLQMWVLELCILSMYLLWRYIKTDNPKFVIFAAFLAGLQVWQSLLPIYFILFFFAIIIASKPGLIIRDFKFFYYGFLIFILISFIPLYKYFQISTALGVFRSIREAAHFSMSLDDLWGLLLSPGLYLAFLLSIYIKRKSLATLIKIPDVKMFIAIGILGLVMSLGPVLKIYDSTFKIFGTVFIPLPYGIFYYLVPGFTALRTPVRWMWLFAFAISGLIAILLSKYKGKNKQVICLIIITVLMLGGTKLINTIKFPNKSEYPPVYHFVKTLPGETIIELPMYSWGIGEPFQHEFYRLLYSTLHKKNLVNGVSGMPPEWRDMQFLLREKFPDTETVNALQKVGTEYVIVHKVEYDSVILAKIKNWGVKKLIWEDDHEAVYKL